MTAPHRALDDVSIPGLNSYRFLRQLPDPDLGEVQEWVDSLDGLTEARGAPRLVACCCTSWGEPKSSGSTFPR